MPITMQERFERAKKHQKAVSEGRFNKRTKIVLSSKVIVKNRAVLLEKQLGCCAICTTKIIEGTRLYHLDHYHDTGVIRGVLCHNCNVGLGHFRDDVELLLSAIDYLNKFRPKDQKIEYQIKPQIQINAWRKKPVETELVIVQQSTNYDNVLNQAEFNKLPGKEKIEYLKSQEGKSHWWDGLPELVELK